MFEDSGVPLYSSTLGSYSDFLLMNSSEEVKTFQKKLLHLSEHQSQRR